MSLWWMKPGWTSTCCGNCGATIYPEGDPDWGMCWPCMEQQGREQQADAEYQAMMEEAFAEQAEGQQ